MSLHADWIRLLAELADWSDLMLIQSYLIISYPFLPELIKTEIDNLLSADEIQSTGKRLTLYYFIRIFFYFYTMENESWNKWDEPAQKVVAVAG